MALKVGAFDVANTLAARLNSIPNFQGANADRVMQALDLELAAHNRIMLELVSDLCNITTQKLLVYGATSGGSMVKVDEYGRGPTQVSMPADTAGIPMHKYQYAVGWTDTWLKVNTPADMAVRVQQAQVACVFMGQLVAGFFAVADCGTGAITGASLMVV